MLQCNMTTTDTICNFLIFCFKDYKKCHKALVFRFVAIFKRMGHVRPNAIMIDKSVTKINVFITVINDDM